MRRRWRRAGARFVHLVLGLAATWALCVACGSAGLGLYLSWDEPGDGPAGRGAAAPGGSVAEVMSFANDFGGPTSFEADAPDGFAVAFTPAQGSGARGTVTVTFTVPEGAALGDYTFRIVATTARAGGGISRSEALTYTLTVANLPDFTVQVDPVDATWTEAGPKTFTFGITPLNGYDDLVDAELSELPAGFSLTRPPISPIFANEQGDFELTWDGSVARQTSETVTLTLISTDFDRPLRRSRVITLRTETGGPGSIELALSPGEFRFEGPNTVQTIEYSIIPRNGFTGTVAIGVANDQVAGLLVTDGPAPASVEVTGVDPVGGTFQLYWDGNPLPALAEIAVTADSGATHLEAHVRVLPN